MSLIISNLSPHNVYLLFCCVVSIFGLTQLVLMALFCAAIRRNSVSLLRFPLLIPIQLYPSACLSLEISIELFFFPFLFSGYFCSVDACVDCIVSNHCIQSSFALSYVVFLLLYRCINAILNADKSSSSFFSRKIQSVRVIYGGCKARWIVMSFLVLWFIFFSSSLILFKNGPEYLMRWTAQEFISLMRFLSCSFVSSSFLVLLRHSFPPLFFHLCMYNSVRF